MPEKPDVWRTGYQQSAHPAARGVMRQRESASPWCLPGDWWATHK